MDDGQATLVRRDTGAKERTSTDGVASRARELLAEIQRRLLEEAQAFRAEHTLENPKSYEVTREFLEAAGGPSDPKREPRVLTVALTQPMGQKAGKTRGSFVGDTRHQVIQFYGEIVQNLKPWQAKAPQLREPIGEEVPIAAQPEPPSFAATVEREEREIGEARLPPEPPEPTQPSEPAGEE